MSTARESSRLRADRIAWAVGGRRIIDEVSLECEPGTVTGVIGPNGSGKTTLLRVLAGLRRPTAGRVQVGGADLHAMRARERARRIALVEQEASTSLELRVRDVIGLGRTPHGSRWWTGPAPGDEEIVATAMRVADVEHLADRPWQTLSGGERQRTHLARAIAQQPGILLLDEPTNHLDLQHQIDFLGRVRELGLTTIAALHDLELAAAFCDRLVVLKDGGLVISGPVADVLTADLLAQVYAVDAVVGPHPVRPRPHLCWNGVVDEAISKNTTSG